MDALAVVRLSIDSIATPLGDLHLVSADGVLRALDYEGFDERMHGFFERRYGTYELVRQPDSFGIAAAVQRYFEGDLCAVDRLAVDGGGTPYQQRVWSALRTIPAGATCSYGRLAAQLGATHARAVGHANSRNPIAIVVPCHRVIGANATLTGYAGGLERKRWLLAHEARHAGASLALFDSLGAS